MDWNLSLVKTKSFSILFNFQLFVDSQFEYIYEVFVGALESLDKIEFEHKKDDLQNVGRGNNEFWKSNISRLGSSHLSEEIKDEKCFDSIFLWKMHPQLLLTNKKKKVFQF